MPVTLYFSHEAEGVTPRLQQLYTGADMVVLEQSFSGDDELNLNLLNELSRGNLLIDDVLKVSSGMRQQPFPDLTRAMLALVYRSGKSILLEHPPFNAGDAAAQDMLASREFRDMPLKKACRLLADKLTKRATYQKTRDEAFAQKIAEIAAENTTSNILVIRGLGHQTMLQNALTTHNVPYTSVTSHGQMLSLFTNELILKIILGGRPTHRELLKALVEQVETRTTSFHPTQDNFQAVRVRVSAMSEKQCEKFLKKRVHLT